MQLTWGTLILVVIAAAIGWFWQEGLRVRDAANIAAIEACTRLGLQFLDGTVAFARLRLVRDIGQLRLRRTYVFDYTAHSIERLQGFVVLLGLRVESVGFARDEVLRSAVPEATPFSTSSPIPGANAEPIEGKVLNLDEWRRSRERPH